MYMPWIEQLCVCVKAVFLKIEYLSLRFWCFSGISEITASVNSSSSDSDVTVSCSATGKPTPILQWKSTEKHQKLSASKMLTKLNGDGSNTTTSVLKLPLSQFHGKHVVCVATSGDVEERSQISLLDKDQSKDEEGKYLT